MLVTAWWNTSIGMNERLLQQEWLIEEPKIIGLVEHLIYAI